MQGKCPVGARKALGTYIALFGGGPSQVLSEANMAADMLERDDLSAYIIAGVPASFRSKLRKFVQDETKGDGDALLLDEEISEWLVARLLNQKRRSGQRTSASDALWRAFSALSAARYHLQYHPEEEQRVRDLRRQVEDFWRELSPMFHEEDEEAA